MDLNLPKGSYTLYLKGNVDRSRNKGVGKAKFALSARSQISEIDLSQCDFE